MRVWSLSEANAALPGVRVLLRDARTAHSGLREAQRHIEDLRIVWGERVEDPSCRDHEDWREWLARFQERKRRLDVAVEAFAARGLALKDVEAGLVDFRALRGDQPVWLCWREGEEAVSAWHPLDGGFAARRPVPDLDV